MKIILIGIVVIALFLYLFDNNKVEGYEGLEGSKCCARLLNEKEMLNEAGLKSFTCEMNRKFPLDTQDFRHMAGFEIPRESCPRKVPDAKPIPFPTMTPTNPVTYGKQPIGNLLPCQLSDIEVMSPTMAPWPTSAWFSKDKYKCPRQTSIVVKPVETAPKQSIERPDGRCGPNFGNAQCDPGRCCSQWEHCGSNPSFCHNLSILRNDGGEPNRVEKSDMIPATDAPLFTKFAAPPSSVLQV